MNRRKLVLPREKHASRPALTPEKAARTAASKAKSKEKAEVKRKASALLDGLKLREAFRALPMKQINLFEYPDSVGQLLDGVWGGYSEDHLSNHSVRRAVDLALGSKLLLSISQKMEKERKKMYQEKMTKAAHKAVSSQMTVKVEKKVLLSLGKRTVGSRHNHQMVSQVSRQKRRRSQRLDPNKTADSCAIQDYLAWRTSITTSEVRHFIVVMLKSGYNRAADVKAMFSDEDALYHFATDLFPRDRFLVLYRCFRFSDNFVHHLQTTINENTAKAWSPALIAAIDESLCPYMGANNPNHVFIIRKPHPNGTKFWFLVDRSGVCLYMSMYERGKPKEAAAETLARLASFAPKGSLIIADAYFGSLIGAEALLRMGIHFIFSVKRDRPNAIFGQWLLNGLGDKESAHARLRVNAIPPQQNQRGGQPHIATPDEAKEQLRCSKVPPTLFGPVIMTTTTSRQQIPACSLEGDGGEAEQRAELDKTFVLTTEEALNNNPLGLLERQAAELARHYSPSMPSDTSSATAATAAATRAQQKTEEEMAIALADIGYLEGIIEGNVDEIRQKLREAAVAKRAKPVPLDALPSDFDDGNDNIFTTILASSMKRNKKTINTLSSVSSTAKAGNVVISSLIDDADCNDHQQVRVSRKETRSRVRECYSDRMDPVDELDREVLECLPTFKWPRWESAIIMWMVVVALVCNA